jgi:hypothetical protein
MGWLANGVLPAMALQLLCLLKIRTKLQSYKYSYLMLPAGLCSLAVTGFSRKGLFGIGFRVG